MILPLRVQFLAGLMSFEERPKRIVQKYDLECKKLYINRGSIAYPTFESNFPALKLVWLRFGVVKIWCGYDLDRL